jgi:deoxyadenosine/deoxycytidine kinase
MDSRLYIVIAGNLGTGKSTAADLLAQEYPGTRLYLETREQILERFYAEPERLAFNLQLDYSLQYLEHALSIARSDGVVVQDRSIFDTHEVFSALRYRAGSIDSDQFRSLDRIFKMAVALAKPTHLVLLDAQPEVSLQRVVSRALSAERGVTLQLVRDLRNEYLSWFEGFELCPKTRIDTTYLMPTEVVSQVTRFIEASLDLEGQLGS